MKRTVMRSAFTRTYLSPVFPGRTGRNSVAVHSVCDGFWTGLRPTTDFSLWFLSLSIRNENDRRTRTAVARPVWYRVNARISSGKFSPAPGGLEPRFPLPRRHVSQSRGVPFRIDGTWLLIIFSAAASNVFFAPTNPPWRACAPVAVPGAHLPS